METIAQFVRELDALMEELDFYKAKVAELEAKPFDNKAKLSDYEVADIRAAYRGGMKQADLAHAYSVNPATISRIVRGIYH